MPKVSILLPAYNRAEVMHYAIRSVLQSDFSDWELIVSGDACTDKTEEVALSFGDPRIWFLNLARNSGGQSSPLNTAFANARGEVLFILNQDDMYFADHLSGCLLHMAEAQADLIWSPVIMLRRSGRAEGPADPRYDLLDIGGAVGGGGYDPEVFVIGSSMAMTRTAMEQVGPWQQAEDVRLLPSQDWVFRAARSGLRLSYRPELSVLCILAGDRQFSYLKTESPEHDRAWSWISGRRRVGEEVLSCLAMNLVASRHQQGWGTTPTIQDASPDPSALSDFASRLGIHPYELRDAVLGRPKGDKIARHRRKTADAMPLEVGESLQFGQGLTSAYLDENWHAAEPDGRWTAAATADIIFRPVAETGAGLALRLSATPLRDGDETRILVNGHAVHRHHFATDPECNVSLGAADGSPLCLTLSHDQVTSPKALGISGDRRNLGLKVKEATLRRVEAEDQANG